MHFDLVTPGLINTHTHLELSFPEGPVALSSKDSSMAAWLMAVYTKMRGENTLAQRRQRVQYGLDLALQAGTTTINDIAGPDALSLAMLGQAGLRGRVAVEFFGHTWHAGLDALLDVVKSALEDPGQPLVQVGLSPHAPYNVSPHVWQKVWQQAPQKIQAMAGPAGIHLHPHVTEFLEETIWTQGPSHPAFETLALHQVHQHVWGQRFAPQPPVGAPVSYLLAHGLLDAPSTLAHMVHTQPEERARLAAHAYPVGVAHCPRSNLYLHGQTLSWAHWQRLDIPVGLGTDSLLSVPDLDMRQEARAAMAQHGWTPTEALWHLTAGGARALHLSPLLGTLQPQAPADWVGWDVPLSLQRQTDDPYQWLFHPGTRARAVAVAGHLCYHGA
jgi:cytosine/adenosine deaminase-related metal-dependent hydrolase